MHATTTLLLASLLIASSGLVQTMADGYLTWFRSMKRRRRPWNSTSVFYVSVSALFAAHNAQAFFATCGLTSPSSSVSSATGVHQVGHPCDGGKMSLLTQRWSEARNPKELPSREIAHPLCTAVCHAFAVAIIVIVAKLFF